MIDLVKAAKRLIKQDKYKKHAEHVNMHVIPWHNLSIRKAISDTNKVSGQ